VKDIFWWVGFGKGAGATSWFSNEESWRDIILKEVEIAT
jgi:hypothetical protein